jgi:hypothetical protein
MTVARLFKISVRMRAVDRELTLKGGLLDGAISGT